MQRKEVLRRAEAKDLEVLASLDWKQMLSELEFL